MKREKHDYIGACTDVFGSSQNFLICSQIFWQLDIMKCSSLQIAAGLGDENRIAQRDVFKVILCSIANQEGTAANGS